MKKKYYDVIFHLPYDVEAENEDKAIKIAFERLLYHTFDLEVYGIEEHEESKYYYDKDEHEVFKND